MKTVYSFLLAKRAADAHMPRGLARLAAPWLPGAIAVCAMWAVVPTLASCKQEAAPEPGVTAQNAPVDVKIPSAPPAPTPPPAVAPSAQSSLASASGVESNATPPSSANAGSTTQKTAAQLDPSLAKDKAPDVYKAKFFTTKGNFTVEVHRDWSPNGADRFFNLVKLGFYNENRFFRVVDGFMVQWGIHGDPAVNKQWQNNVFPDDPVKQSNTRGFMSFATRGPSSRTTQVFINFADGNSRLDGMGFTPFAKVVDGMNVVDALYKGYGEGAPRGLGPDQGRMQAEGNAYLKKDFDKLDWIKEVKIEK